MLRNILLCSLLLMGILLKAQDKKVAILEAVDKEDKVSYMHEVMIRSSLTKAITNTPGYQGFTRTDIDQLMKEHNFQASGHVSDEQRIALGEMSGAEYICISEVVTDGTSFFITASVIHVETGSIIVSDNELMEAETNAINIGCKNLAAKLFGSNFQNQVSSILKNNPFISTSKESTSNNTTQSKTVTAPVSTKTKVYAPANSYTETVNGISFTMVAVQGGSFQMGGKLGNNRPEHPVTLDSYYMAQMEVTNELWLSVMGKVKNKLPHCPQCATVSVTYKEIEEFIEKLNQLTGKKYRLPTEAEWEFAAKGGTQSANYLYSGSNNIEEVAVYLSSRVSEPQPVGTKAANELGIHDMSGNVMEWCSDFYNSSYYKKSPVNNPTGPKSGSAKIQRGGHYRSSDTQCRSTYRTGQKESARSLTTGFRLAISAK